ncbi:F-box/LRR-repeat protein At3g59190-like [Malus sylvestris]|uniref:F-box/LRR-repeat protein At3g59190-like n=1 Tax=Malus sylvestris TaxID=3752 RepID=UPI0021AD3800|nr:F-box/LRR-repeat protein At3g59190-like [Malus sylvestris]
MLADSETKMGSQTKSLMLNKEPMLQSIVKDRISQLPEPVLCRMLSLIPTKYAVRTSVLSKRWKNVWAFVPNIDLDDENEHFYRRNRDTNDYVRFSMFVDRVLFLHEMDIHKFRLHCSNVEDFTPIEGWIRSAIGRNAVEFDLLVKSFTNQNFKLPQSIFMYKKLVVLKVNSNCLSYVPPKSGCFRSLKFLHVTFCFLDNESAGNLFSCCPVLEDLTIHGDVGPRVLNFKISAPELKKLRIRLIDVALIGVVNNFSVSAPKLETLDVTEDVLSNYNLESSKSLVKASVNLYHRVACLHREFSNLSAKLLAGISKVKCLYLSAHSLKVCCLPAFDNLSELKLVLHNCYNWELLTELLKRSPKLEHLVLEYEGEECTTYSDNEEEEYSDIFLGPEWNTPKTVPICVSTHLKTITVMGFKGYYDEMAVTKYLLENGKVLNKVIIYTGNLFRLKKLDKEFMMFQMGSRTCQVEFF